MATIVENYSHPDKRGHKQSSSYPTANTKQRSCSLLRVQQPTVAAAPISAAVCSACSSTITVALARIEDAVCYELVVTPKLSLYKAHPIRRVPRQPPYTGFESHEVEQGAGVECLPHQTLDRIAFITARTYSLQLLYYTR
jgi:hypothetical protein